MLLLLPSASTFPHLLNLSRIPPSWQPCSGAVGSTVACICRDPLPFLRHDMEPGGCEGCVYKKQVSKKIHFMFENTSFTYNLFLMLTDFHIVGGGSRYIWVRNTRVICSHLGCHSPPGEFLKHDRGLEDNAWEYGSASLTSCWLLWMHQNKEATHDCIGGPDG